VILLHLLMNNESTFYSNSMSIRQYHPGLPLTLIVGFKLCDKNGAMMNGLRLLTVARNADP
jgi:hypothetical protein